MPAAKKPSKKPTAKKPPAKKASSSGFSAEERAAMKERAAELKAQKAGVDGEQQVLARIAGMPPFDRAIAKKVHEIVRSVAPDLIPRTWYGFPAYATREGKIVVFYQDAKKFGTRYGTLGFSDQARLDAGTMWPAAYALTEVTPAVEKEIRALVRRAVG
ncbi:MAG: hypothetical protein ACKOKE_01480 [Actinomycetota bacterium]